MKSKCKTVITKYWMVILPLVYSGGGLASLPITINIGNSEKLEKAAKVAIIVFVILLFALVSSSVLRNYLGNVIKAIIIVVIILFSSFWINKIRD